MKKLLLSGTMLAMFYAANAQQRLVLYEEFSGENCAPCAATNPGLWTLLSANADDVLLIKYQSPIPSAGPIYEQNTTFTDNRLSYYDVPFAPYGRMDGAVSPGAPPPEPGEQDNAGHPGYLTQALISNETAVTSPFNMGVTATIGSGGNTINVSVNVNAVAGYTGTNVKLRVALVETLTYDAPPGTNGETEFHHVVRQMYSTTGTDATGANGTSISNSWTSGQSQTYTVSGAIPAYVDLSVPNDLFVVAWIQDDGNANKAIAQAAKSSNLPPISLDVASKGITAPEGLTCGVPESVSPVVTLKNTGSTALTSAQIYYRIGNNDWGTPYSWTGNLAAGQTTQVTLPGIPGSIGLALVSDSVAMPNGTADINSINNNSYTTMTVVDNENGAAFPIVNDFEGTNDGWVPYSTGGDFPMAIYNANNGNLGYNQSAHALGYLCYQIQEGSGYMILPFTNVPDGPKAMDFYVAYAQYQSENDKLEVVYSSDCGATWNSVWSKQGSDLATASPTQNQFIPSGNSQWRMESVDMSAVPNGAQIAFKATSNYGNNMFIDNVNLRTGTTGIDDIVNNNSVILFPNPTSDVINLQFTGLKSTDAKVEITNILGQQVQSFDYNLSSGNNHIKLDVSQLASGVYFLNVKTNSGTLTKKFVKK